MDEPDTLEARGVRLEEDAPDAPLRHRQQDGHHRTALLASVDLSYIGWAEPWRVAFGYLMPAGLTATAAIVVAPARVRLVVPSSESVSPKPASP